MSIIQRSLPDEELGMRQFGFIMALCKTNVFLAYNYFKNKKLDEQQQATKADFTRIFEKNNRK